MDLVAYEDVASFLRTNGAFLNESEAENNSFLAAIGALSVGNSLSEQGAYLVAVLSDDATPLLCAIAARGRNLIVSPAKLESVSAAVPLVANDLFARNLRVPGLIGEQQLVRQFVSAWVRLTRSTAKLSMQQMLYVLRRLNDVRRSPGTFRMAAESDRDLVAEWSYAFSTEALGMSDRTAAQQYAQSRIEAQDIFIWESGQPVCMAARARPTRHGIAINHVYTPPPQRRNGYATSCVAALTKHLLTSGYSFCTLYADLANRESNHIYTRIGYEPLLESAVFEFEYPDMRILAPKQKSGV